MRSREWENFYFAPIPHALRFRCIPDQYFNMTLISILKRPSSPCFGGTYAANLKKTERRSNGNGALLHTNAN